MNTRHRIKEKGKKEMGPLAFLFNTKLEKCRFVTTTTPPIKLHKRSILFSEIQAQPWLLYFIRDFPFLTIILYQILANLSHVISQEEAREVLKDY